MGRRPPSNDKTPPSPTLALGERRRLKTSRKNAFVETDVGDAASTERQSSVEIASKSAFSER